MHTITVTNTYQVDPGVVLDFHGTPAFELHTSKDNLPPTLINDGSVSVRSTLDGEGVWIARTDGGPGVYTIDNRADGTMSVSTAGADSSAFGFVFFVDGAISNEGHVLVSARQSAAIGIDAGGSSLTFDNSGEFLVQGGGDALGIEADKISDISNFGLFSVTDSGRAMGWLLQAGGSVTNDGTLSVTSNDDDAVDMLVLRASTIVNSGSIIAKAHGAGAESYAIQLGLGFRETVADIVNTGLIRADHAIEEETFGGAGYGDTIITNSGKIFGSINLGDYNDQIHNTGKIVGQIDLGKSGDLYEAAGKGRIEGDLYGGGGDDTLTGGRFEDAIHGDTGHDRPADGADLLDGGGGDDLVWGDGGADTLTGGGGGDILYGGSGANLFVYRAVADASGSTLDLIGDLKDGDRIDLSQVDADTTLDGQQHFSQVAVFDGHAGELVLAYVATTGQTSLQGDVDGDGVADMTILLDGDQSGFTGLVL